MLFFISVVNIVTAFDISNPKFLFVLHEKIWATVIVRACYHFTGDSSEKTFPLQYEDKKITSGELSDLDKMCLWKELFENFYLVILKWFLLTLLLVFAGSVWRLQYSVLNFIVNWPKNGIWGFTISIWQTSMMD